MRARTVFITGASSGIGRALALEYASSGAHVALAARRRDELQHVARQVDERGGLANVIPVDVCDTDSVRHAVRSAERAFGRLDLVIANAGISQPGHASTLEWADVGRVLDVNLRGAMATLIAAIPIMVAQGSGHLVGISSLAGRRGLPHRSIYCATKAALSVFLDSIRMDLAKAHIAVTDVQPGFVETPILKGSHATPFLWSAERAAHHIVRRLDQAPPVIAFPWQLAFLTSFSRSLPAKIYDPLARLVFGA